MEKSSLDSITTLTLTVLEFRKYRNDSVKEFVLKLGEIIDLDTHSEKIAKLLSEYNF